MSLLYSHTKQARIELLTLSLFFFIALTLSVRTFAICPHALIATLGQPVTPSRVLPLHVSSLEDYFRTHSQPGYPLNSTVIMNFTGQMDRTAFPIALAGAMARHPFTKAVIRPKKGNRDCWVNDANISPPIHWGPLEEPIDSEPNDAIDLSCQSGLRFWVRKDTEQTVLTMQVHHAATDGTGLYRFLGDLLALYGAQTAPPDQAENYALANVDLTLLRNRHKRAISDAIDTSSKMALLKFGVRQGLHIFGTKAEPLAVPLTNNPQVDAAPFLGIHTHRFTRKEHDAMRNFAVSKNATVNDLLVTEMFRAIAKWNREHTHISPKKLIRVMMPSDLREQQDYDMPAANLTAYNFLGRSYNQCDDFDDLLRFVREQTVRIKNEQLGRNFMDAVHLASYVPTVREWLLRWNRLTTTAILSNVGDPSKRFTATLPRSKGKIVAGNLILDDIYGVPPLAKQSAATLAIFSYERRLTISVRCDPNHFTSEHTQEFLNMYVEALRQHLRTKSQPPNEAQTH